MTEKLNRRDILKIIGGGVAGVFLDEVCRYYRNITYTPLLTSIETIVHTAVPTARQNPAADFIRSIDTMKSSRDRAREGRPQEWIDQHIELIANAHSSHVAIATPYNAEFDNEIGRWVNSARNKGLNVWFRGNMSEWEGWFGYEKNNDESLHRRGISEFLIRNGHLLKPNDILTPAPEAENGIGNVWESDEMKEKWRNFLKASYESAGNDLVKLGIDGVKLGNYSMNGDVATILTPEVVRSIGNIVAIDHYVDDPVKMGEHIRKLQGLYPEAKVVVGELGAPIPDINGEMDEEAQAAFVGDLLAEAKINGAVGVNYWVLWDGSTRLVNEDFTPRKVYKTLSDFYSSVG